MNKAFHAWLKLNAGLGEVKNALAAQGEGGALTLGKGTHRVTAKTGTGDIVLEPAAP